MSDWNWIETGPKVSEAELRDVLASFGASTTDEHIAFLSDTCNGGTPEVPLAIELPASYGLTYLDSVYGIGHPRQHVRLEGALRQISALPSASEIFREFFPFGNADTWGKLAIGLSGTERGAVLYTPPTESIFRTRLTVGASIADFLERLRHVPFEG